MSARIRCMRDGGNPDAFFADHQHDGFTLIELLVVIVILGVLATVVVFAVGGLSDSGEASAAAADQRTLQGAEEAHYAIHGEYASEDELVAAGLLRDRSDLHDVDLSSDATDYSIVSEGSGSGPVVTPPPSATTTTPPATTPSTTLPPGPPVVFAGFTGQSTGTGARTLVIIGNGGSSTHALYTMLTTTPLPDTQVMWLDGNDIDTTADVDAVIAAGASYMVAADSVPIASPSGNTFVGIYMSTQLAYPSEFWWTHQQGNPSHSQLLSRIGS